MRLFGILSSYCCSSVVWLGRLAGIGFTGVSVEASVKAVIFGVRCLWRDVEGTWRGRGSEKGLVVMRLAYGEDSYCEEKFRGLNVGALGGVL